MSKGTRNQSTRATIETAAQNGGGLRWVCFHRPLVKAASGFVRVLLGPGNSYCATQFGFSLPHRFWESYKFKIFGKWHWADLGNAGVYRSVSCFYGTLLGCNEMHQAQNQAEDLTVWGQIQYCRDTYWTQYFLYHKSSQPYYKVGNVFPNLKMKT